MASIDELLLRGRQASTTKTPPAAAQAPAQAPAASLSQPQTNGLDALLQRARGGATTTPLPDVPLGPTPSAGGAIGSEAPEGASTFAGDLGEVAKEIPQAAGGTLGAMGGAALVAPFAPVAGPLAPIVVAGGAVAGAFLGGGLTGFGSNMVEQMIADPGITPDFKIAWEEAKLTGQEEGFFEGVGRAIAQALPGGVRAAVNLIGPKVDMHKFAISQRLKAAGRELGIEGNAGLTLGEISGGKISRWTEELIQDAPLGGQFFGKLAGTNDEILKQINDKALRNINNGTIEALEDDALGDMVIDSVNNGMSMMYHIGKRIYGDLDKMFPGTKTIVTREIPIEGMVDVSGKPLTRKIQEQVTLGPVDTRPMKKWASEQEKSFLIEKDLIGGKLVTDFANLPADASFTQIHSLRSAVKQRRRDLNNVQDSGPALRILADGEQQLTRAMDIAGARDDVAPGAVKQLQRAQKFWREGNEKLNNELIQRVMRLEKTPSKIGNYLFQANNIDTVRAMKKSVRHAARLGKLTKSGGQFGDAAVLSRKKKEVKGIDFKETWGHIQGRYVSNVLEQTGEDLSSTKLIKMYGDRKQRAVFDEILEPEMRKPFEEFVQVMKIQNAKPPGRGTMLNWRQTGAFLQVGAAGGAVVGAGAAGTASSMLFIAPPVLGAMMTRPDGILLLTRALQNTPGSQVAGPLAARIADMAGMIELDLNSEEQQ
jgi:hypothetical protein